MVHEKRAEFNIIFGAALFQCTKDLDLRILLVDAPVGHKPNPRTHFIEFCGVDLELE